MRKLLSAAAALPLLLAILPAGAITPEKARLECIRLTSGYTVHEAQRTGISRSQKVDACVRRKMRANKQRAVNR
jgi:hypothetical protein